MDRFESTIYDCDEANGTGIYIPIWIDLKDGADS